MSRVGAQRRAVVVHAAAAEAPPAEQQVTVTEERLPGCVIQLTVTVSAQLCKTAYDEVLKEMAKQAGGGLPGFRQKSNKKGGKKGGGAAAAKVPEKMLINLVGGEEKVRAAAVEQLLLTTVPMALESYKDTAISGSEAVHTPPDDLMAAFNTQTGMQYVLSVQVPPTVAWKGDYSKLQVEVEETATADMIAADVERRLEDELKKGGQMKVVTGRGVQRGDVTIVDTTINEVGNDGPDAFALDRKQMQLDTAIADKVYMPGVVAQLEGAQVGDTRQFEVSLPADYEVKALQGKRVAVSVTLREVFYWDLPQMDDQWANKLFPGCSLAKVREVLSKNFAKQAEEETQQRVRKALSGALGQLADCQLPEKLVRDYGELEYQARLLEAHGKGVIGFEAMEQLATEELLENFVESNRPDLEAAVREVAAVEALFDAQGMAVDEQEVEREMLQAVAEFKANGQEYDEERLREQVVETLKATAVLDWLASTASITMLPPAPQA